MVHNLWSIINSSLIFMVIPLLSGPFQSQRIARKKQFHQVRFQMNSCDLNWIKFSSDPNWDFYQMSSGMILKSVKLWRSSARICPTVMFKSIGMQFKKMESITPIFAILFQLYRKEFTYGSTRYQVYTVDWAILIILFDSIFEKLSKRRSIWMKNLLNFSVKKWIKEMLNRFWFVPMLNSGKPNFQPISHNFRVLDKNWHLMTKV